MFLNGVCFECPFCLLIHLLTNCADVVSLSGRFCFFFVWLCATTRTAGRDAPLGAPEAGKTPLRTKKPRPTKVTRDRHRDAAREPPPLQTDVDSAIAEDDADADADARITSRSSSTGSLLSRPSPIASDFGLAMLEQYDKILASLGIHGSSGWSFNRRRGVRFRKEHSGQRPLGCTIQIYFKFFQKQFLISI